MIIGVTHNQDGRVLQRLSVSTKVSIGLPPNGDRNHPTKLNHFVFLRKKRTARGVEWEPGRKVGTFGRAARREADFHPFTAHAGFGFDHSGLCG